VFVAVRNLRRPPRASVVWRAGRVNEPRSSAATSTDRIHVEGAIFAIYSPQPTKGLVPQSKCDTMSIEQGSRYGSNTDAPGAFGADLGVYDQPESAAPSPAPTARRRAAGRGLSAELPRIAQEVVDVYCVGLGCYREADLTVAAVEAIRSSSVVYSFPDCNWIAATVGAYGGRYQELSYSWGADRVAVMAKGLNVVLTSAQLHPPVAIVVSGSPVRHVWLTQQLHTETRRAGIRLQIVHGVSVIDALQESLHIDDSVGLQIFDCAHMLALRQRSEPTAHLFVLNLEAVLINSNGADPPLEQLATHLITSYTRTNKETALVLLDPVMRTVKTRWHSLAELRELRLPLPFGTLFVPGDWSAKSREGGDNCTN
jgi:hypothetical protein